MAEREKLLDKLVTRLQQALGEDLISVVLYGSAAADDFQQRASDLNVLAVLSTISEQQMDRVRAPVSWWTKKGQPTPILLSAEELHNACDAFAIEFADIRAAYRILHGDDLVRSLKIEGSHHRHQVEHELRAGLLRLRERFLDLQGDSKAVRELLTESLPSFSTLFRHALILAGHKAVLKKQEVFAQAAETFSISAEPFETVLAMRTGSTRISNAEVRPLFFAYLREVTAMAGHVDRIDKEKTTAEEWLYHQE